MCPNLKTEAVGQHLFLLLLHPEEDAASVRRLSQQAMTNCERTHTHAED